MLSAVCKHGSSRWIKLLFGDNLASNFNMEAMELARQNKMYFCMFPVNALHLFQPLDVSVFAPGKRNLRLLICPKKKKIQ